MSELRFEPQASRLTVETTAVGMLAKLAHDLSIEARSLSAKLDVADGRFSIELEVPVSGLEVDGVRRSGAVDRGVLSASDKAEIERKMRGEVLGGRAIVARAEGALPAGLLEGSSPASLEASARVELGARSESTRATLKLSPGEARVTAEGSFVVHLPQLGIAPIKGPLGAFRVNDDVRIVVSLVFSR